MDGTFLAQTEAGVNSDRPAPVPNSPDAAILLGPLEVTARKEEVGPACLQRAARVRPVDPV